jgi:hypothetical protein
MGISLTGDKWGCLRDAEHRGHSPERLVSALLGCNRSRARIIVRQYNNADPSDLDQVLEALGEDVTAAKISISVESPPRSRPIRYSGTTHRFWRYLMRRGFADDNIREVTWRYNLTCCLTGRFKDRIIIPFMRDGKVIAWTGRAITDPISAPRYLSSDLIKTTVFNEDVLLRGGKLLFITEGPFDAIKLDYYAGGEAAATCTSGTTLSLDQVALLKRGLKTFARVVLLFDHDAWGQAFQALDWLNGPNVVVGQLPQGVKDPADLSPPQIHRLINEAYIGEQP